MPDKSATILAEQLRIVMRSGAPICFGIILTAIALVCLQGQLPHALLDGWAALMLAWQGIRFVLWRRFKRLTSDAEVARQAPLVTLMWTLTGLLWGLFGAAFFLAPESDARFFMLFVVTTNLASGSVAVSSYMPANAGYVIGMVVPMVIAFATRGTYFSLLMAAMCLVYTVVARSASLFGNRSVIDLIRLEVERSGLIASLREAKEAADLANHVKSRFLANISHELRTPLNAIIGFSDVMRAQMFGPIGNRRYSGYIDDINSSGRHLLGVVNDVLDLSKLEASSMQLSKDEIDPAALARDCIKFLRPQADAGDIHLRIEGPEMPLRVLGDELRLKQVLLNLLSNAVKFSHPGGEVVLSLNPQPDGGLIIAVRDHGIGMDAAGVATALLPFGQVENSWTKRHAGTGLGLPLAKWLVELHDGHLVIESALEEGALVKVSLPAARVKRAEVKADYAPARSRSGTALRLPVAPTDNRRHASARAHRVVARRAGGAGAADPFHVGVFGLEQGTGLRHQRGPPLPTL